MSSRRLRHLLVWGYLRLYNGDSLIHVHVPKEIKTVIEQFYPICIEFEGSKLALTYHEKESLTKYLTESLCGVDKHSELVCLESVMLYDGGRDGMNAEAFHAHCDGHDNTLSLIETNFEHIFGIFSPHRWDQSQNRYLVGNGSFLCVIRSKFEQVECPKCCRYTEDGAYAKYGPYAGSGFGPCIGHSFDVAVFTNSSGNYVNHSKYTNYPDAYGNILCGGEALDDTNKELSIGINGDRKYKVTQYEIRRIETFRIDMKNSKMQ